MLEKINMRNSNQPISQRAGLEKINMRNSKKYENHEERDWPPCKVVYISILFVDPLHR